MGHRVTISGNISSNSISPFFSFDNVESFNKTVGEGCVIMASLPPSSTEKKGDVTTMLATYDGKNHVELNIYSPDHDTFDIMKNIDIQVAPDNFEIAQVDYHPRGYGRVVTFQADLKKAYFGTKYPAKRSQLRK